MKQKQLIIRPLSEVTELVSRVQFGWMTRVDFFRQVYGMSTAEAIIYRERIDRGE